MLEFATQLQLLFYKWGTDWRPLCLQTPNAKVLFFDWQLYKAINAQISGQHAFIEILVYHSLLLMHHINNIHASLLHTCWCRYCMMVIILTIVKTYLDLANKLKICGQKWDAEFFCGPIIYVIHAGVFPIIASNNNKSWLKNEFERIDFVEGWILWDRGSPSQLVVHRVIASPRSWSRYRRIITNFGQRNASPCHERVTNLQRQAWQGKFHNLASLKKGATSSLGYTCWLTNMKVNGGLWRCGGISKSCLNGVNLEKRRCCLVSWKSNHFMRDK